MTRFSGFAARLLVLAALVTAGVAIQQYYRVTLKLQDPQGGHINDFDRWMIMTPAFVHDRADYVNDLLPTPPLTLLALAPLTSLSRPSAQFVWVLVKLPLALAVFALALAIVRRAGGRLTTTAMLLVLAGWWLPVVLDMQEGQTNFLALLPLMGALYLAQNERPRWDVLAGVLLGLAIAVKVTPAIFAAYFLWKRRWIVAAAAVAGVAVWSVAVPALVFGWDQNLRWLAQWAEIMIVPYATKGTVAYAISQSFGSFALRLFSAVPVFDAGVAGSPEPHYMNLFELSPSAVFVLVRGAMTAVAVVGLVWMRHRLETLRSARYLIEIGAVAAFMLWFSERTWVHHYVSFLLTLCAAGAILSDETQPRSAIRLARVALVAFAATTVFASEAGYLLGPSGVAWAKGVGVFLWPSVLVTIAATCRWQPQPRSVSSALPVFRYWSTPRADESAP